MDESFVYTYYIYKYLYRLNGLFGSVKTPLFSSDINPFERFDSVAMTTVSCPIVILVNEHITYSTS